MRVLESVVTDSGLASPPSSSYRCKDRPLAFSCTSTSKTHILALQERWIHLGSKRNSFHTAFQTLQDQSIWPNLVDLSKNWREMHDDKNQENLHRTLENLYSLYRGRLLRAGDAARLLDRIETLLPYLLGDRPNHYLRFANTD